MHLIVKCQLFIAITVWWWCYPRHSLIIFWLVGVGDSFLDKHMNVSNDCLYFCQVKLVLFLVFFRLVMVRFVFYGEFDPGSGRTLAACLIHASRADL